MKKTSDDIRILTTEEVEKYFVVSKIHKCNECGNLPQVIEKIQQLKYYTEKQYKCYCPNCKKGTGFSGNWQNTLKNWNKIASPIRYENCYIYSFYPSEENHNAHMLKNYLLNFNMEKHEIVHNKGGERYLYYIYDEKERKLDLERFTDNVAIYEEMGIKTPYGYTGIKVCVVIAENEDMAKTMLNDRLKRYFDDTRKDLVNSLRRYEERCNEVKQQVINFDEYIKKIKREGE